MDVTYPDDFTSDSGSEPDLELEDGLSPTSTPPTNGEETKSSEDSENYLNLSATSQRPTTPAAMTARAYQMEMLEQSLKGNIIVTMDTGSGKTQVAILRIQAEIERSKKLIWFLAPTVALADQQLERIQEQIPSIICKRLCGPDNVDTWSTQAIWDAFLENVGLVVSTPEVLLRACQHGFVKIWSLSLLVIDEAHNCTKKAPGKRLMLEHYRPAKERGTEVPHILGLTASPVASSNPLDLEALEDTLDARCLSPRRHREELMRYVNLPQMSVVSYGPPLVLNKEDATPAMVSLFRARDGMDTLRDPTILALRADKSERGRAKLRDVFMKRNTFAQQKMQSFCHAAREIARQLGPWAADYYIHRVITGFETTFPKSGNVSENNGLDMEWQYDAEVHYIGDVFRQIQCPAPSRVPSPLSRKLEKLVEILAATDNELRGIVFATERTTVAMLGHILRAHPLLHGRFTVGTMVGTSSYPSKKQDLLELSHGDANETLMAFRSGRLNLLVATSVLEEGIDVPACNMVICFDRPVTLKVFIQRRGRARMRESRLILLLDNESHHEAQEWLEMERQMKAKYEDDQRQLRALQVYEDEEHPDYPVLEVKDADGDLLARLTIEDAKGHLDHFCATLSSAKFVDYSPFYIVRMIGPEMDPKSPNALFKATVQLPVSLPLELRQFDSLRIWKSERNAFRDAAFQAYLALYRAGLVNDHLLPLKETDMFKDAKARTSFTMCRERFDPWPSVALAWESPKELYGCTLTFAGPGNTDQVSFELILPISFPSMSQQTVHWDLHTAYTMTTGDVSQVSYPAVHTSNDVQKLISMAFGHRGEGFAVTEKRHVVWLASRNFRLNMGDIASTDLNHHQFPDLLQGRYLVRDTSNHNHPYYFKVLLPLRPPDELVRKRDKRLEDYPKNVPYVAVTDWYKKAGYFLRPKPQPQQLELASSRLYHRIIPAEFIKVDAIPAIYARFGLMYPSLLHALDVHFVAHDLWQNRLAALELSDMSMVTTAICSRAARMAVNYERVEFLGDCILKLCASSNCLAHHPDWPEGYLTAMKQAYVDNARLAQAAVDFGLDRYIITESMTLVHWRPKYVEDCLRPSRSITATRKMATKTLADVVESLIGVSYLDGGLPKALQCIELFMPMKHDKKWQSIEVAREKLYNSTPINLSLPPSWDNLETLLGYTFRNKALLVECMTHASYNLPGTFATLERLEFFGDSLVEYLVVRRLYAVTNPKPLDNWQMHLVRTALVNGDFLGFLVMEASTTVTRNDILAEKNEVSVQPRQEKMPLWRYMRYHSADLGIVMKTTERRYHALRDQVRTALHTAGRYPWALLARLQLQKFYSDLFEAVLGAIYVDSGSFEECDRFLERIGLMGCLERILAEGVKCLHPKEELGQLAVDKGVEYQVEVEEGLGEREGEEEAGLGRGSLKCTVLIGEVVAGEVSGGVSREEVRTRAAERVVKLYDENGGKWWW